MASAAAAAAAAQRRAEAAQRLREFAQREREAIQRRREEVQRQREVAQRQREEAQRQREAAQRRREEVQRQREATQRQAGVGVSSAIGVSIGGGGVNTTMMNLLMGNGNEVVLSAGGDGTAYGMLLSGGVLPDAAHLPARLSSTFGRLPQDDMTIGILHSILFQWLPFPGILAIVSGCLSTDETVGIWRVSPPPLIPPTRAKIQSVHGAITHTKIAPTDGGMICGVDTRGANGPLTDAFLVIEDSAKHATKVYQYRYQLHVGPLENASRMTIDNVNWILDD